MSKWDRWGEEASEENSKKEPQEDFEKNGFESESQGDYYGNRNDSFSEEESDVYKTVLRNGRPKTVGWSVASLVLGILSLVCCCFGWTGAIFGVGAIVFSVVSKRSLGYFDGMAIGGLVCGIFGCVFGFATIITSFLIPEEFYDEFYREYYNGEGSFL